MVLWKKSTVDILPSLHLESVYQDLDKEYAHLLEYINVDKRLDLIIYEKSSYTKGPKEQKVYQAI